MKNLIDIQSQINNLQKQANEIKARDFNVTVQEILAKMEAFGITVKDLVPTKRRSAKVKATVTGKKPANAAKKPGNPVPAKFRGPQGETWSGRGLMPRWLSALVADGQPKENFAIKD